MKTWSRARSPLSDETPTSDGTPATCEPGQVPEGATFVPLGAEVPPTEFARARVKEAACGLLGRNGSRLKAHHHVFDDGTVATRSAFATWIDTETGQGCRFDVAADDVVRCLPSGPHFQLEAIRYYDDPACRQPLYLANPCNDDPLGPPKFALLGAAVTPAAVYAYDDTQVPARCVPVEQLDPVQEQTTVAELLAHHDLRPLGPEVAPSMFVRASPPRLR